MVHRLRDKYKEGQLWECCTVWLCKKDDEIKLLKIAIRQGTVRLVLVLVPVV